MYRTIFLSAALAAASAAGVYASPVPQQASVLASASAEASAKSGQTPASRPAPKSGGSAPLSKDRYTSATPITMDRVRCVFRGIDLDDDEVITLKEARAAGITESQFRQRDLDGDGVVSREEFDLSYMKEVSSRGQSLAQETNMRMQHLEKLAKERAWRIPVYKLGVAQASASSSASASANANSSSGSSAQGGGDAVPPVLRGANPRGDGAGAIPVDGRGGDAGAKAGSDAGTQGGVRGGSNTGTTGLRPVGGAALTPPKGNNPAPIPLPSGGKTSPTPTPTPNPSPAPVPTPTPVSPTPVAPKPSSGGHGGAVKSAPQRSAR